MTIERDHHVVIVGGGFGGMGVARRLAKTNHHLFQPLPYQVATASLATSEIAWPIRSLLRDYANVTTLLGAVVGVESRSKRVLLEDGGSVAFDTFVLATGARHAYFGHDE
jgi:NADH dehydrogenase